MYWKRFSSMTPHEIRCPQLLIVSQVRSRKACLAMVHKLCQSAQGGFQRINGSELLKDVLAGIKFEDGVKILAA